MTGTLLGQKILTLMRYGISLTNETIKTKPPIRQLHVLVKILSNLSTQNVSLNNCLDSYAYNYCPARRTCIIARNSNQQEGDVIFINKLHCGCIFISIQIKLFLE